MVVDVVAQAVVVPQIAVAAVVVVADDDYGDVAAVDDADVEHL